MQHVRLRTLPEVEGKKPAREHAPELTRVPPARRETSELTSHQVE